MSPWTVYWVMQADSIRAVLGGLIFPAAVVAIMSAIPFATSLDESAEVPPRVERWSRWVFLSSVIAALFLSIAVGLAPTTKTLCAVIAIPAIANNDELQADATEIYRLGMERLKEAMSADQLEPPQ